MSISIVPLVFRRHCQTQIQPIYTHSNPLNTAVKGLQQAIQITQQSRSLNMNYINLHRSKLRRT